MQAKRISIKTTAQCNGGCWWCGVQDWMDDHKGYQCKMTDIEKFIKYSVDAGYKWQDVVFTGGEPFLWKHWKEAAVALRESGVVGKIMTYTNGFWIKTREEIENRKEYFDAILVSSYPWNTKQTNMARGITTVIDREDFYNVKADQAYPESIPAMCGCRAYGLFDGTVSLCTSMPFLASIYGWDYKKMDGVTKLRPNFLDYIDDSNVVKREICTWCFGNKRVAKHLDKYEIV